ncbi:extracellular solute-binding protein [Halapricum desulfuricans]|uniref:Maltodextrin-binding protein n=1 Tax=Halapricum desulfuricans TaxID=2841257 RepID=A0A897NXY0_9EURY|nr:extracellular solute-binding protein [Halapricum desulfuricans]QSG14946.1 Maltose-binding periplasmic protein [Halapricum desulfuricans]
MDDELTRRRILRIGGPALAGLVAGCSSDLLGDDSEQNDDWELTDNPSTETDRPTETATETDEEPTDPETETTATYVGDCPDGCDCSTVMPSTTNGSFTLWHNRTQAASQLFDGTKNMFNAMEGPTAKLQRIPSAFQDKLRQDIAAGQGPDAFQWAHDLMGEFVENDMLTDMSDQLRVGGCMFTDSAWDAVQYDGGIYGLPVTMEAPALIYNRDALDDMGVEPPETIGEMKSIMDDWDGDYGFAQPVDTYHVTWAGHMFGSAMYDGKELGLDDPAFAAGLRIILDELKPYMPTDGFYGAQTAAFTDGAAPFIVTGPWEITGFIEDVDFNVGVTTIPDKTGHSEFGDGTARPYMGVRMLYFTSMLDSPDGETATAARDFVEWYATSNERQLNLALNAGMVPAKSNLSGSDQLSPNVRGFSEQTEEAILMPQNPRFAAVWGPYSNVLTQAWDSGTDGLESDLQDAAEDIRTTWDEDY